MPLLWESKYWSVVRPDAIYVWESDKVKRKLHWYYMVMNNELPAKFMIAKKVAVDVNLKDLSEEELWDLHDSVRKYFLKLLDKARNGKLKLKDVKEMESPKLSFLDVKIEIVKRIVRKCELCEWRCRVNREHQKGVCRLNLDSYVTTYFLHLGEEAPLVPSGTIFYGSCNFRCVFCQNYDISQVNPYSGVKVGPEELASIQEYLRFEGARNINHVGGEPTPNLHNIIASLKYLNINVPQLWNSNMYLSVKALKLLLDLIDIWLPDFKYGNNKCALRLSAIRNYYDVISRNMKIICANRDPIIIRHLVLPNHLECCTKPILSWIASNCRNALVNIMDQYRPEFWVVKYPHRYRDIARRPKIDEMMEAYSYAEKLGIDYKEVSR
ncbi:MAG TPA: radical SAM protein [Acidilobales archaeon]|nr:radical SAM protein [Acidilobales archaeon]